MSYMLSYEPTNPIDVTNVLFFYPSINRFADENGNVLDDLHSYFSTIQLDLWKKQKKSSYMIDRRGEICALYYPDSETEEQLCTHRCLWCPQDCDIRDLWDRWEEEQLGFYNHAIYIE